MTNVGTNKSLHYHRQETCHGRQPVYGPCVSAATG